MEISGLNAYSPLGDHISGYGTVDSPGQKQHGSAPGTHRHTAGTRNLIRINVYFITDLNREAYIRIMNIHFKIFKLVQKLLPQQSRDFHRLHGITLIPPAHKYLECKMIIVIPFVHVGLYHLNDVSKVFLILHEDGADPGYAKDPG